MKPYLIKSYSIVFLVLILFNQTLSQDNEIFNQKIFQTNDKLYGLCNIIRSYNSVRSDFAFQNFEINVPATGEYFLNTWVFGAYTNSEILRYEVYIDEGQRPVGILDIKKTNWQAAKLELNKRIYLTSGNHIISFKSPMPIVPMIEFIYLTKNMKDAPIFSLEYDN